MHRKSISDFFWGFVFLTGTVGGYALLRGADLTEFDPVLLALVVGGPTIIVLSALRDELAAGPGWLSVRGMALYGPRRWVRTDRLVLVDSNASGVAVHLHMKDDDGREASIESAALLGAPAVAAQVELDVRRSLARTDPQGHPLLEIDQRSRTILLGEPVPPPPGRRRKRKQR